MEYKILEANGVENENVDGAGFNNFIAGGKDCIIKGVLNECALFSSSKNRIGISSGELVLRGFRIKLLEAWETFFVSQPVAPIEYAIVAKIELSSDRNVTFDISLRELPVSLVKDNIYDSEKGIYEAEIARFTLETEQGTNMILVTNYALSLPVRVALAGKDGKDGKDGKVNVVQEDGYSEIDAMSQKATTVAIAETATDLSVKKSAVGKAIYAEDVSKAKHIVKLSVSGAESPEQVTVRVCGKNLIPFPYPLLPEAIVKNGLTITPQDDGGVRINGTPTAITYIDLCQIDFWANNITPYLSNDTPFVGNRIVGDKIYCSYGANHKKTIITIATGQTLDNFVFYPQIQAKGELRDSSAMEYEKGIEHTVYTPNADGTVDGVISVPSKMTIFTNADATLNAEYAVDINAVIGGEDNSFSPVKLVDGYYYSDGWFDNNPTANKEKTTDYIALQEGGEYTVQLEAVPTVGNTMWLAVCLFDKDKNFIERLTTVAEYSKGGKSYSKITFTASQDGGFMRICGRTFENDYFFTWYCRENIAIQSEFNPFVINQEDEANSTLTANNDFIKSVNHRGHITAPENTLSAFRLSKKKGFEYVECDVSFTADNVPVLLHDSTINRTARNADGTAISGTINISDITYEQALAYDFGIWKSTKYAGEKIPTFAEFLILCKRLGLKPYVEIKGWTNTEENLTQLVTIAKRYDMLKHITWISFETVNFETILTLVPTARIGYVVNDITQSVIDWCLDKKTENNDIFVDAYYINLTPDTIQLCVDNGVPLEVWTVNGNSTIAALDTYISGYTSDDTVASIALYEATLSE